MNAEEDAINSFYTDLQNVVNKAQKDDILIVTDDFNARMGSREKKMDYNVMGMYGFGQSNDRVELLLDFCCAHDLYISNTNFKPNHQDFGHGNALTNVLRAKWTEFW